jgi:hypothetical protein
MRTEIEISRIDRKHEGHRMRCASREKQLLASVLERGIEEPLSGILEESGQAILLDGFKRLRCAEKLGLGAIPFVSFGPEESEGILALIRSAASRTLTLLEQAAFVEDLHKSHGLTVEQIARKLERSKAWVIVRLRTRSEMSEATSEALMSGKFPTSSYFYTLHPVRRLSEGSTRKEIDEFVGLTAGKGLSTRDIELVAEAYFKGGDAMRGQIKSGDLGWTISQIKEQKRAQATASGLSETEQKLVRDLEIVHGCMGRLTLKLARAEQPKKELLGAVSVVCDGVLVRIGPFEAAVRKFYDRPREA